MPALELYPSTPATPLCNASRQSAQEENVYRSWADERLPGQIAVVPVSHAPPCLGATQWIAQLVPAIIIRFERPGSSFSVPVSRSCACRRCTFFDALTPVRLCCRAKHLKAVGFVCFISSPSLHGSGVLGTRSEYDYGSRTPGNMLALLSVSLTDLAGVSPRPTTIDQ